MRKKPWRMLGAATFLMSGLALPSAAQAFYCGNDIVGEGQTNYEVRSRCGEPDFRETVSISPGAEGYAKIERWFYDCGSGRFVQILTFRAGELVRIETGPQGKGPRRCE